MDMTYLTKFFKSKNVEKPVSVVPYVGGKKWLAQTIISLIPPDVISYVEPFGGSATVLLTKSPSPIETYNDIDNKVVSMFRVLSDPNKFKIFHRKLLLTPFSRELYNECKRKVRHNDFENEMDTAYSTYVCLRQGFNSAMDGGWSANYALSSGNNKCKSLWAWANAVEKLPEIVTRLRGVQIEHSTYEEILKRYDTPDTFYNCDPPYPMEERINNGKASVYHNEFSTEDYKKLVDNLLPLKGMVLLTSYWSDAYTELINNGWVANKLFRKMSLVKRERTRDTKLPEVSEYLFISPNLKSRLERYEEKIRALHAQVSIHVEDAEEEYEL